MALIAVSFFIQKLSQLLLEEATFLVGVDQQVRSLRSKLEWISSFLKDADGLPKENKMVKLWVAQIRDVAYDAEDIISIFAAEVEQHRRERSGKGFMGSMKSISQGTKGIPTIHSVGKKIDHIKGVLDEIWDNRLRYGIINISADGEASSSSNSGQVLKKEKRAPVVEEANHVVGLEDEARTLVGCLIEGVARRAVISLTGMGGIGKTTLAKKIYTSVDVKMSFDFHAWVYVSQEYRVREILLSIVNCFTSLSRDEMELTPEEDLRKKLSDYLEGKRYLVVIDDIWTRESWDGLVAAFPDTMNRSRILLTTRNENIAKYADAQSLPHKIRFLDEKESWALFCKKALPGNPCHPSCPPNLDKLGREIVAKCGGLPLAIAVLGGVLSRKARSVNEWHKMLKSLEWWLNESEDQISGILALSYYDLPYYLKPCFLYLGAFPEDSEIYANDLMLLWMAEGFVQQRGEEEKEDVAEDYLEELIDRSMLQTVRRKSNGAIEACRIHDLLRDLAISKSKEDRFLDAYGNREPTSPTMARRLAITSLGISKYIHLNRSTRHLRSLMHFAGESETIGIAQLKILSGRFKLLRVMDLRYIQLSTLPDEIGCLIHLRYLCLMHTDLRSLPSTITNLYNLQTLNLRFTYVTVLPSDIWRMEQMRHLRLYTNVARPCRVSEKTPLHHLHNLQTLSVVEAGSWMGYSLEKLTNLRELGIKGYLKKELSNSINKLVCLRSLQLDGNHQFSIPALSFSNHQHLYKLDLMGNLEKPLDLHELPPTLSELRLHDSRLKQDPMGTLEKLPNLRILRLHWDAYLGNTMVCSIGGFPLLEVLHIRLGKLEEWRVEGAMPSLRRLGPVWIQDKWWQMGVLEILGTLCQIIPWDWNRLCWKLSDVI